MSTMALTPRPGGCSNLPLGGGTLWWGSLEESCSAPSLLWTCDICTHWPQPLAGPSPPPPSEPSQAIRGCPSPPHLLSDLTRATRMRRKGRRGLIIGNQNTSPDFTAQNEMSSDLLNILKQNILKLWTSAAFVLLFFWGLRGEGGVLHRITIFSIGKSPRHRLTPAFSTLPPTKFNHHKQLSTK